MSGEVQVLVFGSALLASVWSLVWFLFVRGSGRDHKADAAWLKRKLVGFWGWTLGALLKAAGMVLSGDAKDGRGERGGER